MSESSDVGVGQVVTLRGAAANLSMLRGEVLAARLDGVRVEEVRSQASQGTKLGYGALGALVISISSGVSLRALDLLIAAARSRGKIEKQAGPAQSEPRGEGEGGDPAAPAQ